MYFSHMLNFLHCWTGVLYPPVNRVYYFHQDGNSFPCSCYLCPKSPNLPQNNYNIKVIASYQVSLSGSIPHSEKQEVYRHENWSLRDGRHKFLNSSEAMKECKATLLPPLQNPYNYCTAVKKKKVIKEGNILYLESHPRVWHSFLQDFISSQYLSCTFKQMFQHCTG